MIKLPRLQARSNKRIQGDNMTIGWKIRYSKLSNSCFGWSEFENYLFILLLILLLLCDSVAGLAIFCRTYHHPKSGQLKENKRIHRFPILGQIALQTAWTMAHSEQIITTKSRVSWPDECEENWAGKEDRKITNVAGRRTRRNTWCP